MSTVDPKLTFTKGRTGNLIATKDDVSIIQFSLKEENIFAMAHTICFHEELLDQNTILPLRVYFDAELDRYHNIWKVTAIWIKRKANINATENIRQSALRICSQPVPKNHYIELKKNFQSKKFHCANDERPMESIAIAEKPEIYDSLRMDIIVIQYFAYEIPSLRKSQKEENINLSDLDFLLTKASPAVRGRLQNNYSPNPIKSFLMTHKKIFHLTNNGNVFMEPLKKIQKYILDLENESLHQSTFPVKETLVPPLQKRNRRRRRGSREGSSIKSEGSDGLTPTDSSCIKSCSQSNSIMSLTSDVNNFSLKDFIIYVPPKGEIVTENDTDQSLEDRSSQTISSGEIMSLRLFLE